MTEKDIAYVAEFRELEDAVRSLLDGHRPSLQGAVLGDIVAMWLAGHAAEHREHLLQRHVEMIRTMIPVNEAAFFGEAGNPLNGTLVT